MTVVVREHPGPKMRVVCEGGRPTLRTSIRPVVLRRYHLRPVRFLCLCIGPCLPAVLASCILALRWHFSRTCLQTPSALVFVGGIADGQRTAAEQLVESARGDFAKMQNAYNSVVKMIETHPDDVSLKLQAGDAAVSLMRIKTNANSLVCRFGTGGSPIVEKQDTPATMQLWAEWAPKAKKHLDEVQSGTGSDAFRKNAGSFILSVEATMYALASAGILNSVLSGNAVSFLSAVSNLESMHPAFDGHIYCIYWGAYYLAAPWPASNPRKARAYLERGVKAFSASRRNQYWAGVGAFMEGDFKVASSYMMRALKEPCASKSEQDVCAFLTREAKRTIDLLAGVVA